MPCGADRLPEPPWTQAPVEVHAWLASTGSRTSEREPRSPRQVRIRGLLIRPSPSEERRLLHRLDRLRFERVRRGTEPLAKVLDRMGRGTPREDFRGTVAGVRILVSVREGSENRIRISFTPRVTVRRARKIAARLGIEGIEGSWL